MCGNTEHVTLHCTCCLDTLIKDATFSLQVPTVFSFVVCSFCSSAAIALLRASKLLTLKIPSSPRAHSPLHIINP